MSEDVNEASVGEAERRGGICGGCTCKELCDDEVKGSGGPPVDNGEFETGVGGALVNSIS